MNSEVYTNLKKMIDVNTPIIYIHDYDFTRVDYMLKKAVGDNADLLLYSPALGWQKVLTDSDGDVLYEGFASKKFADLEGTLTNVCNKESTNEPSYLILRDIQYEMDNPKVKSLIQTIAQRKLYDREFDLTLIISSSVINVPGEIEKYVSFLEIPYPDEDEIKQLIEEHVETNGYDDFKEEHVKDLMPSLKGLTLFEIDRMLDMAMSSGGTLTKEDKEMILRHKKQMVKKSGVLELVDSPENIDSIGGLKNLKEYLSNKSRIMNRIGEALNAGVSMPKGVFIVGMPGCGKSLCAKATAALFECPLLKLDMGSLMGKYQGESEKNLRQAIKIAEAAAPCILWIDEIEKAFTGVGGSEILTRMFGYFLSWLQEKKSSVYVIATANNAANLPPELKRKGRFDEIFCVKLPNEEERKQIFEVHIKKREKIAKKSFNVSVTSDMVKATEGFNGADIESVVCEAIEDCFLKKTPLTAGILTDFAKKTVSISKSCQKQIKEMEDVFKESNFKTA